VLNDGHAELDLIYNTKELITKVPDVTGLGLKDAVYLLENMGLKVQAKGRGKVIYQSLAQNSDYHKGQSINIQLN
jgi:cell division protein FtsI (penicillin-binding protein 3)